MKGVVKFRDGKDGWELREVPRIDPKDDEVEIKINAAGICGSELHLFHDNHYYIPGTVIGHEFTGTISRVGKNISGWNVGDRVVSENHITACGTCEYCRTGDLALCKGRIPVGYAINGGWTNYICMPTKLMIKVPDAVSDEEAAMVEPTAILTEVLCVKQPIQAGETVLIQGCGTIGLLAAMVAKAAGAGYVILSGTEADEQVRLAVARNLGIDRVVNIQRENLKEIVDELTDKNGMDMIVECSGAPAAINSSIELVKRLGRIIAIGEAPKEFTDFPWNKAIFKGCSLKFTFGSNYRAWHLALELMASGKIDVKPLITHRISMADFMSGFQMLDAKEAIKVIMYPIPEKCI